MKAETWIVIILSVIIGIVVLGSQLGWFKSCSDRGNCYNGDCSTRNYNAENCQRQINYYQKQNEVAFECEPTLRKYIQENNLTCTSSLTSHPLDSQSSKYKCCKTCYFLNESGNDYSKEICKIKQ